MLVNRAMASLPCDDWKGMIYHVTITISAFPNEEEILLPPGSRFEVIGVSPHGDLTLVQIRQIPSLEKSLKLE